MSSASARPPETQNSAGREFLQGANPIASTYDENVRSGVRGKGKCRKLGENRGKFEKNTKPRAQWLRTVRRSPSVAHFVRFSVDRKAYRPRRWNGSSPIFIDNAINYGKLLIISSLLLSPLFRTGARTGPDAAIPFSSHRHFRWVRMPTSGIVFAPNLTGSRVQPLLLYRNQVCLYRRRRMCHLYVRLTFTGDVRPRTNVSHSSNRAANRNVRVSGTIVLIGPRARTNQGDVAGTCHYLLGQTDASLWKPPRSFPTESKAGQ